VAINCLQAVAAANIARFPSAPVHAQGELRELRARLADARETIDDLRRRLDRADERLTALLTDQRAAAPAPPRSGSARRWWRWQR